MMLNAEIDPKFAYLTKFRQYFCKRFYLVGSCGRGCVDLECSKRLNTLPLQVMREELKSLAPEEIRGLYEICAVSFVCFNWCFPTLSGPMGSKSLIEELTAAIGVCEQPQFKLSYYKWIVDGLIHANWSCKDAIKHIILHKKSKAPEANRVILDMIIKNRLLHDFFDVVEKYVQDAADHSLNAKSTEAIVFFIYHTKRPNCSELMLDILKKTEKNIFDNPNLEKWIEEYEENVENAFIE